MSWNQSMFSDCNKIKLDIYKKNVIYDSNAPVLHSLALPVKFFLLAEAFMLLLFQITIKEWSLVVSTQGFTNCLGQCIFL